MYPPHLDETVLVEESTLKNPGLKAERKALWGKQQRQRSVFKGFSVEAFIDRKVERYNQTKHHHRFPHYENSK
jgi:hypothetical protein